MTPTVVIAGYYGFGNLGDEAILQVVLSDLRTALGDHRPVVVSGDPQATTGSCGAVAVDWRDLAAIAKSLAAADLLVLGGGGLFHDYWPASKDEVLTGRQQGLSHYATLVGLAGVLQVPHVVYGVGVGPLRTKAGRTLASAIVGTARAVVVRDQRSANGVAGLEHGLATTLVHVGSDLAARLPASLDRALDSEPDVSSAEPGYRILGVNLRYWDFGVEPAAIETAVAQGLDRWLDRGGWQVRLLAFQAVAGSSYEDDRAVLRRVRDQMRGHAKVEISAPGSPGEALERIAACDLFLATRYHSALLALLAAVPTAVLSYDPKCRSLLSDLGLGDQSLALEGINSPQIESLLERSLLRWEERKGRTEAALAALKERGRRQIPRLTVEVAQGPPEVDAGLRQILVERLIQGQVLADLPLSLEEAGQLPARLQRLEAQVTRLTRVEGQLTTELQEARNRIMKADAELERTREQLRSVDLERNRWADLAEGHRRRAETHQRHAREVLADRARLQGELSHIRSTRGFRLLAGYWRLAKRLVPVGSRRRLVFGRLANGLRKVGQRLAGAEIGSPHVPATGSETWTEEVAWLGRHLDAYERFAETHLAGADRSALILAPTGYDPAEGQRSVNFAREMSERGVPVVFGYWRWTRDTKPAQDLSHDLIFQMPLDVLLDDSAAHMSAVRSKEKWLLLEFPYPGFFELAAHAHSAGWLTIYDVVDDWEEFHSVGQAPWYDPDFERHLVNAADLVVASSERLVRKVQAMAGREARLVRNAASPAVAPAPGARPPAGNQLTVGYFGSLSGAWFDWDLVAQAAAAKPDWQFELVGSPPTTGVEAIPANVILHGQRSQEELGAIASRWSVAIAPFRQGPLAEAVDPIKVYEYLALGLPVVVTGVRPPPGAESHVLQVGSVDEFLAAVDRQADPKTDGRSARMAFARENRWQQRVDQLVGLIDSSADRIREKRALVSPP